MSQKSDDESEIRKLRKKLRQIENLERLNRPLLEEEAIKVSKKGAIRNDLLDVLAKCSDASENDFPGLFSHVSDRPSPLHTSLDDSTVTESSVASDKDESVAEPLTDEDSYRSTEQGESCAMEEEVVRPAVRPTTEETCSKPSTVEVGKPHLPAASMAKRPTEVKQKPEPKASKKDSQGAILKQLRKQWMKSCFSVQSLEGHNDLVCSVSLAGHLLLTGSRDTTVRLWDIVRGVELCSMGSHTGCVSAVRLLTQQLCRSLVSALDGQLEDADSIRTIGLSASSDCSLKFWCLDSGKLLKSVYVFNPVTCLNVTLTEESKVMIIIGTGGGKVELLDPASGSAVDSFIAHEDSVTAIEVRGRYIYTASADSTLKVFHLRGERLCKVFEPENVKAVTGGELLWRHVRSLAVANEILYYGDDGMNVKALDWKYGLVHKLSNHTTEFGTTDALSVSSDLLVSSGYDLDNGLGFLNIRHLPDEKYLCSLCDSVTGRIVCLTCDQSEASDSVVIVTGGMELKVWRKQSQSERSLDGAVVQAEYVSYFDRAARDSDVESDSDPDVTSDEDAEGEESEEGEGESGEGGVSAPFSQRRHGDGDGDNKGWFSWCALL